VKYHEDFEKNIKGSKIEVTDDPETLRVTQVSRLVSQLDYKDKDKAARDVDKRRQSLPPSCELHIIHHLSFKSCSN